MGQETKIQWAHHTLNVWRGCAKVHLGCTHCYAEKNVGVKLQGITWGEVWQGGRRVVMAESGWEAPLKWARAAARAGERRRVFCSSLADVLEVPEYPPLQHLTTERRERVNDARKALDGARARLWDVIRKTAAVPSHEAAIMERGPAGLDWLLLTKRPENWELVPEDVRPLAWLGTSISDQTTADEWVPRLLASQGFRLRFLSIEPLVGPVDLSRWLPGRRWYMARCRDCGYTASSHTFRELRTVDGDADVECPMCLSLRNDADVPGIDWVIVGGESGRNARACAVEWVRDIVEQCRAAGVKVFCKQLGSVWAAETGSMMPVDNVRLRGGDPAATKVRDEKGGHMLNWPEDLRVREVPDMEVR